MADAAHALGMKVVGYDPDITVQSAWQLTADVEQAGSVDDLLSQVDFVTFHVPLVEGTRHMINAQRLHNQEARALAALLPEIEVVADCPFNCDPHRPERLCDNCRERVAQGESLPVNRRRTRFVDLPVSATEDRVVGTLDIEVAIKTGRKKFEPGVLASANRGLLYVDEVNLLDDHVVDLLLDSAAMGRNVVEREGISFSHPARFILVGTMNPEEGELRPQLLDRFALCVEIRGIAAHQARVA